MSYTCSKECYRLCILIGNRITPYHNHYLHFDTSVRNYRISKNENFLKGYMRSLWEQHVAWTRLAIISIVFHLPDVNVTVKRLLQNATHMGLSLEPFYGEDAVKI